jgi:chromosome partitioning protein
MGLFSRTSKPEEDERRAPDSEASRSQGSETPEPAVGETPDPPAPETPEPPVRPSGNGNGSDPPLPPEAEGAITVERSEQPVAPAEPANPPAEPPNPPDKRSPQPAEVVRAPEAPDPNEGRMSAAEILAPTRKQVPSVGRPEAEPKSSRAKVVSFANQKGGVAKTTTTLNLAVAFAESGHQVLCVDLDPQGNLTMSQGIDPDKVDGSMYDVLVDRAPIRDVIQRREIDIAVASIDLAGAEIAMSTQIGRERSLEKALAAVRDDYDFICIDTPPSLGLLTINALTASDKVIVPVQCEYLSMRGLVQLQNTLEMIQENLNPGVEIEGILPTMLDSRTVHAKEAVEILEENFGELVFKSRIRKAVKFAEAPVRGSSVLKYDPKGNAAQCYRELAEEVLTNGSSQ